MMGVPLLGPSFAYGDSMSIIQNNQRLRSVLNKKSSSIFYHAYREAVAMDEMLTGNVRSKNNSADLGTKVLGGSVKRNGLFSHLLHDITDSFENNLTDEYFTCEDTVYHLDFYGFPCQHTLAKYGTENQNMSFIGRQDCNLVTSSRA